MRRRRFSAAAAFGASLLVTAWAGAVGAPTDQYQVYGKTNNTITDLHTNLTWQRTPDGKAPSGQVWAAVPYGSAVMFCTGLGGGFRLPTYKELLTLVDEDPHYEYDPDAGTTLRYIDPNAFPSTPAGAFWSLSARGASSVMAVNFGTGEASSLATSQSAYVRCVR